MDVDKKTRLEPFSFPDGNVLFLLISYIIRYSSYLPSSLSSLSLSSSSPSTLLASFLQHRHHHQQQYYHRHHHHHHHQRSSRQTLVLKFYQCGSLLIITECILTNHNLEKKGDFQTLHAKMMQNPLVYVKKHY